MKTILFMGLLALVVFGIYSFKNPKVDFKEDSIGGIQFFNGTIQEALEKAKKENKPIFLDIYATWCGPCKMLKKNTFSDKEVGDYYNTNFINIAIDSETKEGRELVDKYRIEGYPTLLILDKNGKQIAKQLGFVEPHILVNFGKRIVP
ncbi:thioredoxin family protein [Flavobacterium aquidurense]|uniref:thioredoxin family protein n=1 Tax=Flavobacterium aquidurense TaxID=362413 RepID=UPI0037572123